MATAQEKILDFLYKRIDALVESNPMLADEIKARDSKLKDTLEKIQFFSVHKVVDSEAKKYLKKLLTSTKG